MSEIIFACACLCRNYIICYFPRCVELVNPQKFGGLAYELRFIMSVCGPLRYLRIRLAIHDVIPDGLSVLFWDTVSCGLYGPALLILYLIVRHPVIVSYGPYRPQIHCPRKYILSFLPLVLSHLLPFLAL